MLYASAARGDGAEHTVGVALHVSEQQGVMGKQPAGSEQGCGRTASDSQFSLIEAAAQLYVHFRRDLAFRNDKQRAWRSFCVLCIASQA